MRKINSKINCHRENQNFFRRNNCPSLNEYKAFICMFCILTATLFIIPLSSASAGSTKTVKIFLLGGQSNMLGRKKGVGLKPPLDKPFDKVKIWTPKMNTWMPLLIDGINAKGRFGPEISFGHAISDAFPGEDIRLIKYAASGTALYNDWSPKIKGKQYLGFINTVKNALSKLKTSGTKYEIAGMMWLQGESDAHEGKAATYEKNLAEFIAHMRKQFKTPQMPFVIARVRNYYGSKTGQAGIVRKAQEKIAEKEKNVAWFNTDDCSMFNKGHYNMAGLVKIGERFAKKYKEIVQKAEK